MKPAAAVADGAGYQCRFSFAVHGVYNFTNQPAARSFAGPVAAAIFGAIAGEAKSLFGGATLPSRFHKRFIDGNWLVEILDMAQCVLNAEQFGTGFRN